MLETNWKMKILGNEMATWDVWNLECVKFVWEMYIHNCANYCNLLYKNLKVIYIYGVTLSNVTPFNIF